MFHPSRGKHAHHLLYVASYVMMHSAISTHCYTVPLKMNQPISPPTRFPFILSGQCIECSEAAAVLKTVLVSWCCFTSQPLFTFSLRVNEAQSCIRRGLIRLRLVGFIDWDTNVLQSAVTESAGNLGPSTLRWHSLIYRTILEFHSGGGLRKCLPGNTFLPLKCHWLLTVCWLKNSRSLSETSH